MKKVSVIVHKNYLEDVIKNLHENGLMEIIDISKDGLEEGESATIYQDSETCVTYELRLSRLIGILKKIKPKKTGIKSFLNPDLPHIKNVEDHNIEELFLTIEGLLEKIENNILNSEIKLQEHNETIEVINNDLKTLNYLRDFDIDISFIGESDFVLIKAGITSDLDALKSEINNHKKTVIYSKKFVKEKEITWAVLVVSHISEKEKIEKNFKDKIIEFDLKDFKGKPKDIIKSLTIKKKEIIKEKEKITKKLQEFANQQLNELLSLKEEIHLERVRKEISKNFLKTNTTYIINGWILEKDEKKIHNDLKIIANDNIICNFEKPSQNPDNPPTHLKTPRWGGGFKGLVEMFSLPKYGEINPTFIMGIFFVIFFGLMLGDAGYGLIILFLSIYGYLKIGKHSEIIHDWSIMGILMGIITTIVGLLTNGFFGDLIPRFFYDYTDKIPPLYSLNLFGIQLPANPIKDPITLLIIALIFGLIHLNVGVFLGIIQAFKSKKYKEALTVKFCWIPLQLGGGMLIGYFILDFRLTDALIYISVFLVIIGIIQLFISEGPIGFFNITGYVGDWLSYARLLALGLATAGMALAFNVVAQLLGEMIPFIGIVITIILLVFAHMVNLGLQALGAGIHSLRLQYVEFFNRFYEGGGHEFSPFKVNRKYTKIKKEKNE